MGLGLELAAVRKDGTSFPVDVSLSHVRMGDETTVLAAIRDVTERKQAEEALRKSEARLRVLADATFAVVWRSDPSGEWVGDNASWRGFTGQTEEEIRDGRWIEAVHPDDRGLLSAVVFRATARVEARLRHLDGEWRDMVVRSAPIRDGDGAVHEWIGAAVDVTERKRAEKAIRLSEERYRSLFSNMLNGFAYCRMQYDDHDRPVDFVYLSVNEAFGRLTGLTNVVGKPVSEVIPGIRELSPEVFETYGRVASIGIPETFEFDFKSQAQWLNISVYSPEKGSFVAVFDDITERKQAEETIRISEARLKEAQRVARIGSWELNLVSGELIWSDEIFRLFEMDPSQFGATHEVFLDAIHPEDREMVNTAYTRSVATRQPYESTHRLLMADGRIKYVQEHCESFYDAAGRPLRSTGTMQDVSESKRSEALLESSRTELRALAAHLDAVREEERANLGRNLHDDLGQALTALKMDMRALRRRVAKGGKISLASLDPVDELVDGLIATGRQVVSELHAPVLEGLTLRDSVEFQAAEFIRRTRIHCDVMCTSGDLRLNDRMALLLYRIVQESLTNVARHAAATAVTIAIRAAGDDLVLLVEDNGRGIAAESSAGGRFGIIGMRERALALGGRFAIRGGVHGGTVVEVVVPFGAHDAVEGGA